ncbi:MULTISPECIES: RNA polymerase sigma factor RpoH [Cysteiniphilum]|uniref:RNA polymerase sigma factor RpoH n=1 Tax=Cysteiniphilum litorale TaxID=2056700 RepID=A0A8J2Z437_9GAMM|nr:MULTISPECIES: RNA polymerase sigma factor RpoH [Cysteiniphilum]WHN65271.1 RNA polymerase sigma factor RpoH [Cysteiniphilum sp. QT6929]GGF96962.1 RNA polymerase sigma factor RpoH [Cysteiniphilum litorale]
MGKELVPKKNTLPIPALSDTDGLDSYIRFASSIPMLSEEEEKELAHRLRQQNDIDAAQKLILSHLRFVVKVARGFSGYGLPITDLIQEGNIGLMKAVRRFDPDVGVRLVSFAVHWVKAEMHDYILKNWRIVKIATTKAQRKLFFNLRSSKERLGWFSDEEIQSVAKELGVKPETVLEMEKRMNAYDMAFDAPVEESDDESSFHPALYLEDQSRNPEQTAVEDDYEEKVQGKLQEAIDKLDARSKDIILSRWFAEDKLTLHDLAAKHDVSAERIRQIEELAMDKLKRAVTRI